MLILTSNGLSSDALIEETKKLLSNKTKAVLITTASVGFKENDRQIPRFIEELEKLGLSSDFFDFDTQDPAELYNYDLIELIGGNPFYLLKSMHKFDCANIFTKLIKEKIVVGISAGSIIFQKSINMIAQYSLELNNDVNLPDLSALGLTDLELLPHYSKYLSRFEQFEERARKYETENNCKVLRINDGQAVFLYEDGYEIV